MLFYNSSTQGGFNLQNMLIEKKRIEDLKQGDILFQKVGKMSKEGYISDSKIISNLKKHQVPSIYIIKKEEKEASQKEIKENFQEYYSDEEENLNDIKENLEEVLKNIYLPFSEENDLFDSKKRKKQITYKDLFEVKMDSLHEHDIEAGSQAILPPHKLLKLQNILMEAFNYFNFLKIIPSKINKEKSNIPRQHFSSVRLKNIYHPKQGRIEILGDSIIGHAIDTSLYFMATLVNINKDRQAKGKPVSTMKYFVENNNLGQEEEFCYRSDFIINAVLGSLLAPLGFMHKAYFNLLHDSSSLMEEKASSQENINLIKKSSLVSFNLVRNREDISAITKLIIRKQGIFQNGQGSNHLKDKTPLHEFVRLYQIINLYSFLTNPFLPFEPFSRQEIIDYMKENSETYSSDSELKSLLKKPFDRETLNNFLAILAPYPLKEIIRVFNKNNPEEFIYKAFVLNYDNDEPIPIISVIFDYGKMREVEKEEFLIDIPHSKILIKQEGTYKQAVSDKIKSWIIESKSTFNKEPAGFISILLKSYY